MLTEQWRPVDGHPDYEVSDLGRVRSWKKAEPTILKSSPDKDGYMRVNLDRKTRRIHQLVAIAFMGGCPDWACLVRHLDGDNTNNRLENLKWGTLSENMHDRTAHGRNQTKGELNGRSKLTQAQVDFIRKVSKDHGYIPKKLLAGMFDVSHRHLNRIVSGQRWT